MTEYPHTEIYSSKLVIYFPQFYQCKQNYKEEINSVKESFFEYAYYSKCSIYHHNTIPYDIKQLYTPQVQQMMDQGPWKLLKKHEGICFHDSDLEDSSSAQFLHTPSQGHCTVIQCAYSNQRYVFVRLLDNLGTFFRQIVLKVSK